MTADKILEKRDEVVESAGIDLSASIPDIQKEIYRKFLKVLKQLDTDSEGRIKTTTANLKTVTHFVYKDVKGVLRSDEYKSAVKTFTKAFDESARLTDQFYDAINE